MSDDGKIYKGQPLLMELDTEIDCSEATSIKMKLQIGGAIIGCFDAALKAGSTSIIKYQFVVGEINAKGLGEWWACVDSMPGVPYKEHIYEEGE